MICNPLPEAVPWITSCCFFLLEPPAMNQGLGRLDSITGIALTPKTQLPQLLQASPLHPKSNIQKKMNSYTKPTCKLQIMKKFSGEKTPIQTQNDSPCKQNCFLPVPPASPASHAWHSRKSHMKPIYSYPGTAHVTNVHNLDAKNHQDISAFLNYILSHSSQEAQKKRINFYAKNWVLFTCAACSEHGVLSLDGKSEWPNLSVRILW